MLRRLLRINADPIREARMADQLKWRLRTGLVMTLALAILVTSPMMALAGKASDDFIVKDTAMDDVKMLEPLAIVELDNGDEIMFNPLPGERGGIEAVFVSGVRSQDRASIRSIKSLRDANPLELFVALARPGRDLPAVLVELYGDESRLGRQGWARDIVLDQGPSYVSCPAVYWGDQLDLYADAFNDDDPFTSTWDGPNTKPGHWAYIGSPPADGKPYYELNGQANDVTAFYGSVIYCVEDWENASTYNGNYVGNYVTSHFRVAGTGTWYFSGQTQLEDVGDMYEHIYNPGNKFSPGATKYDFHMEIYMAKPADQFHIGATWVYGGPTDITLGS